MEMCSDDHDEIVFTSRDCPVCTAQEEITRLEEQLDRLS